MLQVVPSRSSAGRVRTGRDVPAPRDRGEDGQAGSGCVNRPKSAEQSGAEKGNDPVGADGPRDPTEQRQQGAPSQSNGGAAIRSSRCCTMWTCSSRLANGLIGDAKAM